MCKLCYGAKEDPTHLLNECPALWRARIEFESSLEFQYFKVSMLRFFQQDSIKALERLNTES